MRRLILALFLLLIFCSPAWAISGPVYVDSYSPYWQPASEQHWPDMASAKAEVDRLNNLVYFSFENTHWEVRLVKQYPYKSGLYGYFYPECAYIFSARSAYNYGRVIAHEFGHWEHENNFTDKETIAFLKLLGYSGARNKYAKGEAMANAFVYLFGPSPQQKPYSQYLAYWLCATQDNPNIKGIPTRTRGDVDNDKKITSNDVVLAKSQINIERIKTAEEFGQYWSADVSGDGRVNESDVLAIEKKGRSTRKEIAPWRLRYR